MAGIESVVEPVEEPDDPRGTHEYPVRGEAIVPPLVILDDAPTSTKSTTATGRIGQGIADAIAIIGGQKKVYYGWWLLAGAVVAMAIGSGFSFWSITLYVEPLESEFGWSRAQVTGAVSVSIGAAGFVGPLVGRSIDAKGPRRVIIFGAVATGISFVLMAMTTTLWQWYVFSGASDLSGVW